jgi:hypothetical protein
MDAIIDISSSSGSEDGFSDYSAVDTNVCVKIEHNDDIISISSDSSSQEGSDEGLEYSNEESKAIVKVKVELAETDTQMVPSPCHNSNIPTQHHPPPEIGTIFHSFEEAVDTIYAYEESQGYKFVKGQSKKGTDGGPAKKYTLRCSCYRGPVHTHSLKIDPADHREGRSMKTNCQARANLNRQHGSSFWTLTSAQWTHNCQHSIPSGGSAQRPPSAAQKQAVSNILKGGTYTRRQVKHLLGVIVDGSTGIKGKQISNLINGVRREERDEVSFGCSFKVCSLVDTLTGCSTWR